jgi:hypothetical protein
LIAVVVADSCDGTFQTAPKLQWSFHHATPSYYNSSSTTILSVECSMLFVG